MAKINPAQSGADNKLPTAGTQLRDRVLNNRFDDDDDVDGLISVFFNGFASISDKYPPNRLEDNPPIETMSALLPANKFSLPGN